jgi:hypothetical protein
MKKAWIEDNFIKDVCPNDIDPLTAFGEIIGAFYNTNVPDNVKNGWLIVDGEYISPPDRVTIDYIEPICPESITRFQALAALHNAGLLDAVITTVNLAGGLTKIAFDNAQNFNRSSPTIAAIQTSINLTDEQLDNLFIAGSLITA